MKREGAARWLADVLTYGKTQHDIIYSTQNELCQKMYLALLALTAPHVGATGSPTTEAGKVEEAIKTVLSKADLCGYFGNTEDVKVELDAAVNELRAAIEADKAALIADREDARNYAAEIAQGVSHYPHDESDPCVRCERDEARAKLAAKSGAVDYEAGIARAHFHLGKGVASEHTIRAIISVAVKGAVSVEDLRLACGSAYGPKVLEARDRILAALATGEAK